MRNTIGGALRTVIEPDRLEHQTYPASIIVPLFQIFARSTGLLWTDVVGYVESVTGQNARDVELRLTDPGYENVPLFEDRIGALMLEGCAKMSAFVTAAVPPRTPMQSEIRYAGLGSAEVSFFRDKKSPVLRFLLQDKELREVVITRPNLGSEQQDGGGTVLYRFRAQGIRVHSKSYGDILEAAHEYAKHVNANSWDVWWQQAFPKVLQPIVALLSRHMQRVDR